MEGDVGGGLNLKEVARDLGVHYMTAYRYVRQGRLPATWVDNSWLISDVDLAAFRSRGMPAAPAISPAPSGDGTSSTDVDWASRLLGHLTSGDETAAWSVIESALAAGVDARGCYLDVLSGAMASLGTDWGTPTEDNLVDERLATATALRLVHRLGARFSRPGRRRGTVLLGAPVGERHTLPVAIAADLIRLAGFNVLELGADVPAATFVAAAQRTPRLVAVGISLTTASGIDGALDIRRRLADELPDVAVLVGGQAVANPTVAEMFGSDGWAADGGDLVTVLCDLAAKRRR